MTIGNLFSLNGKCIVVTGATGLIGECIVNAILQSGASVLAIGRRTPSALRDQSSSEQERFRFMECDLSQEADLEKIFLEIENSKEIINGLLHLAVMRDGQNSFKCYHSTFHTAVYKNSYAQFRLWDFFSKHMASNSGGSLVNMSSIYGNVAPDFSIYDGTYLHTEPDYAFIKAGGIALVNYYASLYGENGVRSNSIVLGGIRNDQPEIFSQRYAERTCLKRMGNSTDAIGGCIFLLSDASNYITGTQIVIDGGLITK